jgi:hypothetical protein
MLVTVIYGQDQNDRGASLLFHGIVLDSRDESALPSAQIFVNRSFSSVSDEAGKFSFFAHRKDTVVFRLLGFKTAAIVVSDTLRGKDYVAGIYMSTDTVAIEEVVILPRLTTLKSDILNKKYETGRLNQNASNNIALSGYVARMNQNKLGDPATNYQVIRERQKESIFTRGQIPDDRIVGLSPLILVPAVYMLIKGLPEALPAYRQGLTEQEVEEIHKRYLESIRKK